MAPDPVFLDLLGRIDDYGRPATSDEKRKWGTAFANECAVMLANELRPRFRRFEVRPNPDGTGAESLTGVGGDEGKRVDVLVSNLASGLQVAISLKAENFAKDDSFGRNLMNRLYELSDETRAIHSYQPRATVVGIFFMPMFAMTDRKRRSTANRAVATMRMRAGRLDRTLATDLHKLDLGFVAFYVPQDVSLDSGELVRRDVLRLVDVKTPMPRVGRPIVSSTLSLREVADRIEAYYRDGLDVPVPDAEPESDLVESPTE